MKAVQRILRFDFIEGALAWLASRYIHIVDFTTRWTITCPPETKALLEQSSPFIGCFWHGRMLLMSQAWPRKRRFHILISRHRDGLFISRSIAHLNIGTISGSPKRGGAAALLTIEQRLNEGDVIGVTPDGPRGPRMRAKNGAVKAAQLSGAPILPVSGSASFCWKVKSWDRFLLVLPFGRGELIWGEPIYVPTEADDEVLERHRLALERSLNEITAESDRRCGHDPMKPASETETRQKKKERR